MFGSRTEFTGKHMLFMMLAFFGVIIGVNLIMATFATSTWTGLIVKNSYVASQDFNAKLEKARKQEALGWTSSAALSGSELSVKILDAAGKPLSALNVVARVYRPVAEAEDHDVALTAYGVGAYRAKVDLGAGLWEAAVLATDRGDRTYEQIFRFIVKDRTQ